jgi:hypothetical protein
MNTLCLRHIAGTFRFIGTSLNIVSLTVLLLYAINALRQQFRQTLPPVEPALNSDALLQTIQFISDWLATFASSAGLFETFFKHGPALAAGFGIFLAAIFWLTGRGLEANAFSPGELPQAL